MYNGKKINSLIKERQILKKELGEAVSMSNAQLDSVINGNPTVRSLEKIADYFSVSMDVFFEREFRKDETAADNSEISYLKALLEEKERTIQILLDKQQK